jgi:hypothetical protein
MNDTKKKVASKTVSPAKADPKASIKVATKAPVVDVAKAPAKSAAEKPVEKVAAKVAIKAAEKVVPKVAVKSSEKVASKAGASAAADAHSYNPEYLVLMQKDPNWMQAFWNVNDRRVQAAVKGGGKLVLRLYDISSDLTVRNQRNRTFRDISVPADARSWYIENSSQSAQHTMSFGSIGASGKFEAIVDSSQVVSFGSEGQFISATDDRFVRASLGGVGPGGFGSSQFGLSSQQSLPWTSSLAGSSESGSSWGFSSSGNWNAGAAAWQGVGKDFFLWVKTRLIVYGGTRPDANLQVRGERFPLNPDGTFSFEQDLPDSNQIIPVFATDKDGDFPTTIVPIVVKRTE